MPAPARFPDEAGGGSGAAAFVEDLFFLAPLRAPWLCREGHLWRPSLAAAATGVMCTAPACEGGAGVASCRTACGARRGARCWRGRAHNTGKKGPHPYLPLFLDSTTFLFALMEGYSIPWFGAASFVTRGTALSLNSLRAALLFGHIQTAK